MLTGLSVSFLIGSAIQQAMDKGINKISFYTSVAKPSNMLSADTFWSMRTIISNFLRFPLNLHSISYWAVLELTIWFESEFLHSKIRRHLWFFHLILCSLNWRFTKYPCNYPIKSPYHYIIWHSFLCHFEYTVQW